MATKRPRAEEDKVWDAFQNCWTINGEPVDDANESDGEEFVSLKERRALKEERLRKQRKRPAAEEEEAPEPAPAPEPQQQRALVDEAEDLRRQQQGMDKEKTKRAEEEARMLREAARVGTNALKSAREIADDTRFGRSLPTDWRPLDKPLDDEQAAALRKKWCILCDGNQVPPPIKSFEGMGLPRDLLSALREKNIRRPTPIQVQGLPVALSGRDMIGIAFTGSGKTVAFSIPLIIRSLERERKRPLRSGEGPVGVVLCPSRELARQTHEVVSFFMDRLDRQPLRSTCAIGGEPKQQQLDVVRRRGVHAVVATPGRFRDFLDSRAINLQSCVYMCLDEGDRMLDLGFDEEVHRIMNHFSKQRQTLLFSATMPKKFQDFARGALVDSITVNVSRAGAANLDVIQEVEYVKLEARIVYLLECLQKTAPPVVVFCERKGDVDDVHEYLLLKGVEAVSIHGGKDQEERNDAIRRFKDGSKDVLVATDVAAKGLDFPDIQHVINFDMPSEIENYVHRIGRTGRCGKTGVATTFINKTVEPSALLDLKHLLVEAKQRVPPVLQVLDEPEERGEGCAFCGGLGHTILDCPKRDKDARRLNANRRDMLSGTGGPGGDW